MSVTWYDRQGQPIDMVTANRLLADREYSRIAHTRIASGSDPGIEHRISTVWLGLDHSHGHGPLLLFETMTFGGTESQNQSCWRWSTEDEARAGHAEIIATVAATVPDEQIRELDD